MQYFSYISFFVMLGICIFSMINMITITIMTKKPKRLESEPFVSILVPARNEEKNIENCLKSLVNQEYKNYEIIVLDDHSEDKTALIVENLAKENPKIRLLKGAPLPSDWVGKQYACYQLAKEAKGEYLLFTDADTVHSSKSISWGMTNALFYKSDLLSCFPQQKIATLGTGLIIPTMYIASLIITPVWLIPKTHNKKISAACGQYMLFKKDPYWKIGGHETTKDTSTEDWILAKIIKEHRFSQIFLDGTKYVSSIMYETFREAFTAFARHTSLALEKKIESIIGSALFLLIFFFYPTVALIFQIFSNSSINKFILATVLLQISFWTFNSINKRLPIWTGPLIPFSMLTLSIAMFYGYFKSNSSGGLVWKGRPIN